MVTSQAGCCCDHALPALVSPAEVVLKIKKDKSEDCVAFILLTVVRKMGAVLRSDNFVEGAKIVLRADAIFRLVVLSFWNGV